jgi:hypothetical protein
MPANKQINNGAAKFFKTLGYNQLSKDVRKAQSKEEFQKYMHVARCISKKSQYHPGVVLTSKRLEELY